VIGRDVDREKRASALFFFCGRPPSDVMMQTRLSASAQPGPKQYAIMIDSTVHKVTRAQVGGVSEPGRYLFTFGWLTITEADLAVWKRFPDAAFTLVAQPGTEPEEYRLGAFVP